MKNFNRSMVGTAIAIGSLSTPAIAAQFDLVVTSAANNGNSKAIRFDGTTGEAIGAFTDAPDITDPRDIVLLPSDTGTLNINNGDDRILTYNAQTGELLGEFAFQAGLNPGGAVFGPNGNYFVGARTSGAIAEFDGETGEFVGNFLAPGQVDFPRGFDFGENGEFFYLGNGADPVTASGGGSLVQIDSTTGEIVNANFVSDSQLSPLDVVTSPEGDIFVSSEFPFGADDSVGTVRQYDPTTGALLQVFDAGSNSDGDPLLSRPRGIGFGPDDLLYVSSTGTGSVVRFDPDTGDFIDVFAEFPNLNGQALTFVPPQAAATPVPEPASILALLAWGSVGIIGKLKFRG